MFKYTISVVVPPEKTFDNYFYLSSTSQQFKNHFIEIAQELKRSLKLNNKSLVVDIGSNDGIFLEPLKENGIRFIGVEPARNVQKLQIQKNSQQFLSTLVKKLLIK